MTPERCLKKRLRESFERHCPAPGGWNTSLRGGIGGQKFGMPDQVFAFNGRTVWIESKVLPHKLTATQFRQITAMRAAGMRVLTLTYCPVTKILQLHQGGEDGKPLPISPWTGKPPPTDIWNGQAFSTKFWKEALG